MPIDKPQVLVLDAMGVIYSVGDDVADLLVPFILEHDGNQNREAIEAAYREASLGKIDADKFWQRVNVPPRLEDEYLLKFELSDGLIEMLESARSRFSQVACLSNDVSRWSRKLRQRFQLEPFFSSWFISGD